MSMDYTNMGTAEEEDNDTGVVHLLMHDKAASASCRMQVDESEPSRRGICRHDHDVEARWRTDDESFDPGIGVDKLVRNVLNTLSGARVE